MIRKRSSSLTQTDGMEMEQLRHHSNHVSLVSYSTQDAEPRLSSDELTDLEDATLLLKEDLQSAQHTDSWLSKCLLRKRKALIIVALLSVTVFTFLLTRTSKNHKIPFSQPPKIGPSWPGFTKIENYFAFGDSWTTTHFWVEGDQPSPSNPLGNPEFPGFTSSNDINYVGYLATQYNSSFLKAYDFAYSGSVIDANIDYTMLDWLDLSHQVKYEFLEWYSPSPKQRASWTRQNSLFSTFFGINDVLVYNRTAHRMNDVFATYETLIGDLYAADARNFLLINIPPIDRAPAVTVGHTKKEIAEYSRDLTAFNQLLADLADHLRRKFEGITLFVYDVHDLFERILDQRGILKETAGIKHLGYCPEYEGFEKGMKANETQIEACDGLDVNEFLWLNKLHITPPAHAAMAFEIAQMLRAAPAWKSP